MKREPRTDAWYQTIWRWHFYAGLFVMPMVVVLAATGTIYLFKPQIDAWEERAYTGLPEQESVAPETQVAAALAAFPATRFEAYRLPASNRDAAMIHLDDPANHRMRDVFVSPGGKVVGSVDPGERIAAVVRKLHGQLLLGRRGSWLVELAASWVIVMILSGLYLWWPRGARLGGMLWPRLHLRSRALLRDIHAVTGFWVAGLALVLLVSGLPWADVWGTGFKAVRAELGLVKGRQAWTSGGEAPEAIAGSHADHDHAAMLAMSTQTGPEASGEEVGKANLAMIVNTAKSQNLPFPVMVIPPGAKQPFGAPPRSDWTVDSDPQNRPLAQTLRFDPATGAQTSRETFADGHPIDRLVGYGVAWREGALFGLINQLIGLATALMLITLSVSGFVMWRKRKPAKSLGAPGLPGRLRGSRGLLVIVLCLAALLPMFALSLGLMWVTERLVLRRIPSLSQWLGLGQPDRTA